MSGTHKHIKKLEISLHQRNVRSNATALELLIHPLFLEVGYSGQMYNRESVVQALVAHKGTDLSSTIWSQNFEFIDLAPSIIQVVYLSARQSNGVLTRHARRTSIWENVSDHWKIRYHQATPTAPFCKPGS